MADTSDRGSAIPSLGHPSSAGSWQRMVWSSKASLSPREPAEPGGSSFRRRLVLCFCRSGNSTVPRLPFDVDFVFQASGGVTPGGGCVPGQEELLVMVLWCEGV